MIAKLISLKKTKTGLQIAYMRKFDISKIVFYSLLTIVLLSTVFGAGLYSGINRTFPYKFVTNLTNKIQKDVKLTTQEASTLTKTHPTHFLQPAVYPGDGVTINKLKNNDLILNLRRIL